MCFEKIKSLEDALMHSKLPLEKPFDSVMSNDDATSSSHDMSTHRTMFVKPSMSIHHSHTTSGNKSKRYNSIPTCHYCGISGHMHPNCFQLHSQKLWDKEDVPREDSLVLKIKSGLKNKWTSNLYKCV